MKVKEGNKIIQTKYIDQRPQVIKHTIKMKRFVCTEVLL